MKIAENGSWLCETKEPHGFDEHLAAAIFKLVHWWDVDGVKDFGCGSGAYVDSLCDRGIWAVGYDGNPNTVYFSPHCYHRDLSKTFDTDQIDCVLSLEVGEHIPEQFEKTFLDNITNAARKYVIMSWFPDKGEGIGHVNERPNTYVIERMGERGFDFMGDETIQLRDASTLWWFKKSLLVFKRRTSA